MAYFARINDDSIVIDLLPVDNDDLKCDYAVDGSKADDEGTNWLNRHGFEGRWLQTSFNGSFRANYATYGMFYDAKKDAFYDRENPGGEGWTFNEKTLRWVGP